MYHVNCNSHKRPLGGLENQVLKLLAAVDFRSLLEGRGEGTGGGGGNRKLPLKINPTYVITDTV